MAPQRPSQVSHGQHPDTPVQGMMTGGLGGAAHGRTGTGLCPSLSSQLLALVFTIEGAWLDSMILAIFFNLNNSIIL